MIGILKNKTYAALLAAQVVSLLGTGLMTVALGLLAFDLAGAQAGAVLGTAYAIKMVAYVGLSPVMAALAVLLPRKAVLVGADLARAGVALALPFVSEIWQVYLLIFLLQSASATFTPVFQATIPDVLTDEADYTRALSLSRLAYDLENLLSPMLAALLLSVMSYHWLFAGTVAGFAGSVVLVILAAVPVLKSGAKPVPFWRRVTRGSRIYLATPRLRGLLALNLSAAAIGAFVLVNTVVLVRVDYERGEAGLALAMMAFGAGSMTAALVLPRLLDRARDRMVMVPAALGLAALGLGFAVILVTRGPPAWNAFLILWALTGAAYSAVLTPSGRLLRQSSHAEDRPAVFAAQFALSHACWLVTYPLAGWVGGALGLPVALAVLSALALAAVATAIVVWPAGGALELEHDHPDLPPDHPHLRRHRRRGGRHTHVFVIDDEHRVWPTHG